MSKAYSSNSDYEFVFLILIAVTMYRIFHSYDLLLKNIRMYLLTHVFIVLAVFVIACSALVVFRLKNIRDERNLKFIDNMDGLEFERLIGKVLVGQGYTKVKFTEKYDFGVDIIAQKEGLRWGIQCKRYSGLISKRAVEQVVAGLRYYKCDKSMVITNSSYTNQAKVLAKHNDCVLVDRPILRSYMKI